MKVMLTGGAGYIGSHTAVELLNSGYEVVIVDNYYNSNPEVLKRIKTITNKEFSFYEVDVCDKEKLEEVFIKENIDAVIHFAGYKAVGESVQKPIEYYRNNLDSTLTLLELMKKYNVNNIAFSSSATVYGAPDFVPITEDSVAGRCTNPYGWTKYMIEVILQGVQVANPDFSIVLLRYFNPIGAHESGLIGEDPKGIPNNLVPYVAQVACGIRDHVNVFGNDYDTPDGTGVRDYIHVVDLAKGHVKAIEYISKTKGLEIVNLGTGNGYSVLDIIKTYEKACGKEIPYVIAPRRAGDIATCYADPTKAFNKLGWKAEKNLFDMCKDSWNWQSKNPTGYSK